MSLRSSEAGHWSSEPTDQPPRPGSWATSLCVAAKKYLSSSTENPNFRSINLGLTYTFLVVKTLLVHCPIYFNVKIFLWKTYLEVNINSKVYIFYEAFTLLLSYVVPVKSKVKISQNLAAFSEYMNFTCYDVIIKIVLQNKTVLWSNHATSRFKGLSMRNLQY